MWNEISIVGPVDILCVYPAAKTNNNAVIQCPIPLNCPHEGMVREHENVEVKSLKIEFNNLDQKCKCVVNTNQKTLIY